MNRYLSRLFSLLMLVMSNAFVLQLLRHQIILSCCDATQTTDGRVKLVGLQCLVKIVTLNYDSLEPYMEPAFCPITLEAMRSDDDEVKLFSSDL